MTPSGATVIMASVTTAVDGRPVADVVAALAAAPINVTTTVAEHSQFDTGDRGVHPLAGPARAQPGTLAARHGRHRRVGARPEAGTVGGRTHARIFGAQHAPWSVFGYEGASSRSHRLGWATWT